MKSRKDTDIFFMDEMPRNAVQTIVDFQKQNLSVVKRRQTVNNDCSACGIKQKSHLWIRKFSKSCTYDTIRYEMLF